MSEDVATEYEGTAPICSESGNADDVSAKGKAIQSAIQSASSQ